MSIGNALADARTRAGLTVEAVSEVTRIRVEVLRQIEQDDFTTCGGDFYARGHIRTIAKAVGIECDALVAEYDVEHPPQQVRAIEALATQRTVSPVRPGLGLGAHGAGHGIGGHGGGYGIGVPFGSVADTRPVRATNTLAADPSRSSRGSRGGGGLPRLPLRLLRRANWTAVLVGVCVLVLVVAVVELTYGNRSKHTPTAVIGRVGAQTAVPKDPAVPPPAHVAPAAVPTTSPAPPTTPSPTIPAGVTLQVKAATGASWVSASGTGGRIILGETLARGATRTASDPALIRLVVGNAGAVDLVVNGHDIGAPGGTGQVVQLSFGPGAPTTAPSASPGASSSASASGTASESPSPAASSSSVASASVPPSSASGGQLSAVGN